MAAVTMVTASFSQAAARKDEPIVLTAPSASKKKPPEPIANPPQLQVVPLSQDSWTTIYDGYGVITYDARYGIILEPKVATAPSITHAGLTLANLPMTKNFRLSVTASTTEQLRLNSPPNPWEVFWIFFNYTTDENGKKKSNYFLLKPNGVELGTAYDELGQTFLQTAPTTASALGVGNKFDIEKNDNRVVVYVNGQKVIDFAGAVFDAAGSIGLYTEDARVHVTNVQFAPL